MSSTKNFELFHLLSETVTAEGYTSCSDWPSLCREILALDPERLEIILAIIMYYASLEKKTKTSQTSSVLSATAKLPFKAKTFTGGLGFVVDVDNLPARLQDMIGLFVREFCRS